MTSFLTDAQKTYLSDQFYQIHDTFARPISIFRTAQQIVLAPNQSNNYIFEAAPFNDIVGPVLVSGVFNARIRYPQKEMQQSFSVDQKGAGQQQIGAQHEAGDVRIVVDVTGYNFLFDAKRVRFDNAIWSIESSDRPHSLVGAPKFYDFVLNKLN